MKDPSVSSKGEDVTLAVHFPQTLICWMSKLDCMKPMLPVSSFTSQFKTKILSQREEKE